MRVVALLVGWLVFVALLFVALTLGPLAAQLAGVAVVVAIAAVALAGAAHQ